MKSDGIGRRLLIVIAMVGLCAVIGASSASAQGNGVKCPDHFTVQSNAKIDGVPFKAGKYKFTVKRMSCQGAIDYFKQFLAVNQSKLPSGWRLFKKRFKFKNSEQNIAFRVKRVAGGGGGGGGGNPTGKCPGTFHVQNNDKINDLSLPAGHYEIRVKRMACQTATSYFKQFLKAAKVPKGWRVIAPKQKFKNKKQNIAFRVRRVG